MNVMSDNLLIIVESPTKIRTIKHYLPHATIESSVGHIRDLPGDSMGLDANLNPIYVPTKPDVIKKLIRVAKGKHVILMTDDDREGEAIAYHLHQVLDLRDDYTRAVTQSLTEKAIKRAIENGRKLDMNLVHAQECRRVADRLIGYRVSPLMQNLLSLKSAGRVQTVALRLLADRHRLIMAFNRLPYLEMDGIHKLTEDSGLWKSELDIESLIASGKFNEFLSEIDPTNTNKERRIISKPFMIALRKQFNQSGTLKVIDKKIVPNSLKPPAPLTTSTLIQRGSNHFDWSSGKTMKVAQNLFELGVITYHRTDSTYIEPDFVQSIRNYIGTWQQKNSLTGYLPSIPNTHAVSEHAQAGHEAIRPTDLYGSTESLTEDNLKLYKLIWGIVISSQMSDARFERTEVRLDSGISTRGVPLTFKAKGRIRTFDGWQAMSNDHKQSVEQVLPTINIGDTINFVNIEIHQKHTKAPSRYTEAQLVKELEKRGIGRPSTFASTIETLKVRKYSRNIDKFLDCTEAGLKLIESIESKFQFVEYDYTAEIESEFDRIAQGKTAFTNVVHSINKQLDNEIEVFLAPFKEKNRVGFCPSCKQQKLIKKVLNNKLVYQCLSEKCNSIFDDNNGTPKLRVPAQLTDVICPQCNSKHLNITAYKEDKHQRYWFCSDKKCGFITQTTQETVLSESPKPDLTKFELDNKFKCLEQGCNGVLKRLYRKDNDEHFWKCPQCNSSYSDQNEQPVEKNNTQTADNRQLKCPNCPDGSLILSSKGDWYFCSNNRLNKCKTFVPVKEGKPDFTGGNPKQQSKVHNCPNCNKPLEYRKSTDKFICSEYRTCRTVLAAKNGEPDMDDLKLRQKKLFI